MKRSFDVLAAILGVLIFLPLIVILAVLVRFKLGAPIYFHQVRPGKNSEPFTIVKFRTMRDSHIDGKQLPDNQRMTTFGNFLRTTSLDELPGVWNVLKGDMSLVGPRPLLLEYLSLYNKEQKRRHEVRPGITGWAQINGRNAISWEEKFKLDIWYVDNQSFLLDLKILILTVKKVFLREGVSSDNHVTMEKFTGNE